MTFIAKNSWVLIALCIILNTLAQALLKQGLLTLGSIIVPVCDIPSLILRVLQNPMLLLGLVCFGLSLVFWLMTLSQFPLSVAYPLTSLAYVLTAFVGYRFFGESLSFSSLIGIFVIIFGVYLVSRSA